MNITLTWHEGVFQGSLGAVRGLRGRVNLVGVIGGERRREIDRVSGFVHRCCYCCLFVVSPLVRLLVAKYGGVSGIVGDWR